MWRKTGVRCGSLVVAACRGLLGPRCRPASLRLGERVLLTIDIHLHVLLRDELTTLVSAHNHQRQTNQLAELMLSLFLSQPGT
jgi:hypothetical protein